MATSRQNHHYCRNNLTTDDEKVARLVIETAKFLGAGVGETLPVEEVREQASASGFEDDETDSLLADVDLLGADSVVVPPQRDLFGDVWSVEDGETLLGPVIENGEGEPGPVERFESWLQQKADDDGDTARHASHSYTLRGARKKYARAKDVDRWFSDQYGTFSTVLITLCAKRQPDETLAEHARRFYPEELTRKTYYALDKLGVTDGFAGLRMLSPKTIPENRLPRPNPTNGEATTHAHTCLWIPGEVWPADFRGIVAKHIETVDGATAELHPLTDAISVRTHDSEHLRMSKSSQDGRAPTTALPGEVGDNLPLLRTEYDGEGLPTWGLTWAAHLRLGTDGSLNSRGLKRWRPLGSFNSCADEYKDTREGD